MSRNSKWKNGLLLDIRRLLSRRVCRNTASLILENAVMPFAVACIVGLAFLSGRKGEYGNSFVYFTTLYAFWIGMFGSCQSLNGELQNGEWSYWVLGIGRSRVRHVFGIFLSNALFAFAQLLFFVAGVLTWLWILEGEFTDNAFVSMFITSEGTDASDFYQMNGALYYVLKIKLGQFGPLLGAIGIWCLALSLASLSGIGIGMLFSAVFKEPVVSLNISIGFVVLLGMVSRCGLQGNTAENDVKQWFRNDFADGKWGIANRLETVSRLLPQRYFFNVGRITFEEEGVAQKRDLRTNSLARIVFAVDKSAPWLKTESPNLHSRALEKWIANSNSYDKLCNRAEKYIADLNMKSGRTQLQSELEECYNRFRKLEAENVADDAPVKIALDRQIVEIEDELNDKPQPDEGNIYRNELVKMAREGEPMLNGFGLKTYRKLLKLTLWREIAPLLVIFTCCSTLTVGLTYLKGCYHELR